MRFPRSGDIFFGAVERFGARLAQRKHLAILLLAAAPIVLRLSLLWLHPIPISLVHDEFAQLLAGDTFAHGRLTNPASPLWIFFETIHVNVLPSYMSKYPPAQGAVLAIGQLLGHPWIGVLLSVGVMCGAALWMLQGWFPSTWALLGGLLIMVRVGISSYWIDSYWGGAIPAIGGALVVGAMPRILRNYRTRDALALALGAAILANSRPLEGMILCAPVTLVLLVRLCGRKSPPLRQTLPNIVLPFSVVMVACLLFVGYYNRRLTGNALLFPEALNEQTYSTAPPFIWQDPAPRRHYANAQLEQFYNGWAVDYYWALNQVDSFRNAVKHAAVMSIKFVYFFLWPELCVPLLAFPWIFRDRRVRYFLFQIGLSAVGWYAIFWFLPHYAAPATAIIFALLVQSLRHLRTWSGGSNSSPKVGVALTRVVVLFAVLLAPFNQRGGTVQDAIAAPTKIVERARFAKELDTMPGEQLAIVRYTSMIDTGEWVYNESDIDHAKVVWAREIPGIDLQPLLNHFRGRKVWLVEPDENPPRLSPYPTQ